MGMAEMGPKHSRESLRKGVAQGSDLGPGHQDCAIPSAVKVWRSSDLIVYAPVFVICDDYIWL